MFFYYRAQGSLPLLPSPTPGIWEFNKHVYGKPFYIYYSNGLICVISNKYVQNRTNVTLYADKYIHVSILRCLWSLGPPLRCPPQGGSRSQNLALAMSKGRGCGMLRMINRATLSKGLNKNGSVKCCQHRPTPHFGRLWRHCFHVNLFFVSSTLTSNCKVSERDRNARGIALRWKPKNGRNIHLNRFHPSLWGHYLLLLHPFLP